MNMFAHLNGVMPRSRMLLASTVATGILLVPLAVSVPPSGASGSSSFCTQYRTWAQTKTQAKLAEPVSVAGAPTSKTAAGWHTFGKRAEPYIARMAADAPNAKIKKSINGLLTILKYYSKTTSAAKLEAFFNAHQTQWDSWSLVGILAAEEACI
jgi:hypothetical protein